MNTAYEGLLRAAEERRKCLEDSIKLFGLSRECEEVEAWVREKEAVLKGEEKGNTKEQLDSMQKKYDVSNGYTLVIFSNTSLASLLLFLCTGTPH